MQRRPNVAPRGILGDEAVSPSAKGGELAAARRITEELLAMEAGDRPFTDRMRAWRGTIVSTRGERYYTDLVAMLLHRAHPPYRARQLFDRIRAHKAELARALSRDPGIRVAAMDYVVNVEPDGGEAPRLQRAAFRAVAEAGRRDPETGLLDRGAFHSILDRALVEASKRQSPAALVIARIEGEGLDSSHLVALALALEAIRREGDVLARHSAGSLAILLGDTDEARARCFVERLGGIAHELPRSARVRFGIAVFPEDAPTGRGLLHAAERPLEGRAA